MIRKLAVHLIRAAFIGLALAFVAPLVPGIAFSGSIVAALGLGAGLLLVFGVARWAVKARWGVGGGACPTPKLARLLVGLYLVLSVLYVGAIGLLAPSVLTVGGVLPAVAGGFIALVGAVLSNFVTRFVDAESQMS